MPELPEIETVVRDLRKRILGSAISRSRVYFSGIIKGSRLKLKSLSHVSIVSISRRGKYIVIDLSGGQSLLIHLKLTGQFILGPRNSPLTKHTHLVFELKGLKQELRYLDIRKFGRISLVPTASLPKILSSLGPEPLSLEFPQFLERLRGRHGRLKPLLLNQRFIAGIGNIYADEILYRAKLRPAREISWLGEKDLKKLFAAIKFILRRAIKYRGSSIRDFRDGLGEKGFFHTKLHVYGRGGERCHACGHKISRVVLAGRGTHFCGWCQR